MTILSELRTVERFLLPPDSGGAAAAFARMGYQLKDALADIIDNAVDSKARNVEIIFHRWNDEIAAVTIADDGCGMTQDQLRSAMRFAASKEHDASDLGTYGLGLKTASFSQCDALTVISRKSGTTSACRWTKEGIGADWSCEALDAKQAAHAYPLGYSGAPRSNASGTVVLWQRLNRLDVEGDVDAFVTEQLSRLELQLGLIFHRFLADGRLSISLAARNVDSMLAFPRRLRAHDPFGYSRSGRKGYPKIFTARVPGVGPLELKAHIWPAGATDPNFRLGRRTGTHGQGFYVYRNDRLVQTGGWLGAYKDDGDAELSLARVAVELPSGASRAVSVQKSSLQLTAALAPALRSAKSGKIGFDVYMDEARLAYRADRRKSCSSGKIPLSPGAGIPASVRRTIAAKVMKDDFAREIAFEWVSLPKSSVFSLDPNEDRILLNRKYRQRILGANRASGVDAPVVKMLLFALLENEFDRERTSAKQRNWLKRCNALLLETIKAL